jgi:hypothetical protein
LQLAIDTLLHPDIPRKKGNLAKFSFKEKKYTHRVNGAYLRWLRGELAIFSTQVQIPLVTCCNVPKQDCQEH